MVGKPCSSCGRLCQSDQFRPGKSQCRTCEGPTDLVHGNSASRMNNATEASFEQYDLDHPFAEGSFRLVAKGQYTHGKRAGEPCVCKWFKDDSVHESQYYQTDIKTAKKAIEIIDKWNDGNYFDKVIQVNLPEVWESCDDGRKVLQEPFIKNYQKFNSNTGWMDDHKVWFRLMQALSHFSYHVSDGQFLLCDLQGGVYRDGVVLTDPVVMSQDARYGPTDLGAKGISSFFGHHRCNQFCRPEWRTPKDRRIYFTAKRGTTMHNRGPNQKKTGLYPLGLLSPIAEMNSRESSSPPIIPDLEESNPSSGSHPLSGSYPLSGSAPSSEGYPSTASTPTLENISRKVLPSPQTGSSRREQPMDIDKPAFIHQQQPTPQHAANQEPMQYEGNSDARHHGDRNEQMLPPSHPPNPPYDKDAQFPPVVQGLSMGYVQMQATQLQQQQQQQQQQRVQPRYSAQPAEKAKIDHRTGRTDKGMYINSFGLEMSPNSIIDEIGPSIQRYRNRTPRPVVFRRGWAAEQQPATCGIFFPAQPLCVEVAKGDEMRDEAIDLSHRQRVKQRQRSQRREWGGRRTTQEKRTQSRRPDTPRKERSHREASSRKEGRPQSRTKGRKDEPQPKQEPRPGILQQNRSRKTPERRRARNEGRSDSPPPDADSENALWPLSAQSTRKASNGRAQATMVERQPIIQAHETRFSFSEDNSASRPPHRDSCQPTMTMVSSYEDCDSNEQIENQPPGGNSKQFVASNRGRMPPEPRNWQGLPSVQGGQGRHYQGGQSGNYAVSTAPRMPDFKQTMPPFENHSHQQKMYPSSIVDHRCQQTNNRGSGRQGSADALRDGGGGSGWVRAPQKATNSYGQGQQQLPNQSAMSHQMLQEQRRRRCDDHSVLSMQPQHSRSLGRDDSSTRYGYNENPQSQGAWRRSGYNDRIPPPPIQALPDHNRREISTPMRSNETNGPYYSFNQESQLQPSHPSLAAHHHSPLTTVSQTKHHEAPRHQAPPPSPSVYGPANTHNPQQQRQPQQHSRDQVPHPSYNQRSSSDNSISLHLPPFYGGGRFSMNQGVHSTNGRPFETVLQYHQRKQYGMRPAQPMPYQEKLFVLPSEPKTIHGRQAEKMPRSNMSASPNMETFS